MIDPTLAEEDVSDSFLHFFTGSLGEDKREGLLFIFGRF